MTLSIDLILGTLFVLAYANQRFNQPINSRSTTTVLRYYTVTTAYYGVVLAFYLALTESPELIGYLSDPARAEGVDGIDGQDGSILPDGLSAPLLAALLLTVLLPRVPILSNLDEWVRRRLKYIAAIPYEARRRSAELRRAAFQVPAALRESLRGRLTKMQVSGEDILLEGTGSLQQDWARVSAILMHLEDSWEANPRFAGFLATFSGDYKALKARYADLSLRAGRCLEMSRDCQTGLGGNSAAVAVQDCVEGFKSSSERLFHSMCDFISRGVLQCNMTSEARTRQLRAFGFDIATKRHLTVNQILTVFSILFLILMTAFMLIGREFGKTFAEAVFLVALIATNYTVAVICAVVPRVRWKFARVNERGERPVGFYLLAGTMAVAFGVPIGLFFRYLTFLDFDATIQRFVLEYPWYLLTFATAVITAFQLDNHHDTDPKDEPRFLRWIEAAGQMGVTVVITLFIVGIALPWVNVPGANLPGLIEPAITNGLAALFIGFFVPTWYRHAPHEAEHRDPKLDANPGNLEVHLLSHY